jgi:pterin-4a-carbinolamine dehydratase
MNKMNTNTTGMMEMVVISKIDVIARLRRVPRPVGLEAVEALVPAGDFDELKPERVQEWLSAQSEWRLAPAGKVLHRARTLPTCEAAMHYASFVASLATALAVPAKVRVTDRQVELSLFSPRQSGRFTPLTGAVLGLATRIG